MPKIKVIKQSIFNDKVDCIRFEIMRYYKDIASIVNEEHQFLLSHLQSYVDAKCKFVVRALCYMERPEGQSRLYQVQSEPSEFTVNFLTHMATYLDTQLEEHDIMWPTQMILELSFDCIRNSSV